MPKDIEAKGFALPSMVEEQQLVADIAIRHQDSKNYLTPYWSDFQRYYQMYRSIPNASFQGYQGRANLYVPYAYSTVETVMPRLTANQPKISVAPRNPTDLKGSKKLQTLVDYYWQKMKMKAKYKGWVKDSLIYGTSILKLTWKTGTKYDGPCAEVVDLAGSEIYFDPTTPNINDPHNWWIHEYEETLENIKANKNYTIANVDELTPQDQTNDYYKDFREFIAGRTPGKDTVAKKGKIWEFWGEVDGEARLIVILNEKYIIRNDKNPYDHDCPPFIAIVDVEDPHEPLGIGEIEPIESLQYELNDVRNQRMDNVTMILHRMWEVLKGADIDESELVWRPNGIVHTDIQGAVKPIEVPDVTRSSYNEETLIKQDIATASGVTDYARGLGNQGSTQANETARGISMMQEVANARFQLKLDNIEDGIILFGERLIALIQQFLPEDMVIRITDDRSTKWQKFTKKDIQGQYDAAVEMGATQPMNRQVRRAEARELLATVAPYVQQMADGQQRLTRYLKFLEETYNMPTEEDQPEQMMPMEGQPVGSTPGQPGAALAGMEGMLGQMGANMGGVTATTPPSEVRNYQQL